MIQCSVKSCESNLNSDLRNNVIFFDFPQWEDAKRFHKWVEALGRPPEFFKLQEKFVCSRHFRLEDFEQNYTRVNETTPDIKKSLSLLENAVPSLYLSEDNKNSMKLPSCDINTELVPSANFILHDNFIKTEKINEKSEEDPQEENLFELTKEEKSENQQGKTQSSVQEAQSRSNDLLNKKFKCVDCKESFSWSTELKKHKRITHGTYVCNICFKHVVKLSSLKTHKKTKHNISYIFSCEDCDEAFFRNRELLKHMKIHKKVPANKCTKCRKKFGTDAEFSNHHCIIGKKLFQCETCRKCFAAEANLNIHKKKYHTKNDKGKEQEKKYECDVCEKAFKKTYRLAQHKRLHEKPFQCDTCKKAFSEKSQLKVHKLNHAAVECIHLGQIRY